MIAAKAGSKSAVTTRGLCWTSLCAVEPSHMPTRYLYYQIPWARRRETPHRWALIVAEIRASERLRASVSPPPVIAEARNGEAIPPASSNADATSNCAGAPTGRGTRRLTLNSARSHHHWHRPEFPEIIGQSFRNPKSLARPGCKVTGLAKNNDRAHAPHVRPRERAWPPARRTGISIVELEPSVMIVYRSTRPISAGHGST